MSENKKNKVTATTKCKQCNFYNKEEDNCKVKSNKEFREYSRKNNNDCNDFLIKDKLVMF